MRKLEIAPCDVNVSAMPGDEGRRRCTACHRSVRNLSLVAPDEALAIVEQGDECVSFDHDEETDEVVFRDHPESDVRAFFRGHAARGAAAVSLLLAACSRGDDGPAAKAAASADLARSAPAPSASVAEIAAPAPSASASPEPAGSASCEGGGGAAGAKNKPVGAKRGGFIRHTAGIPPRRDPDVLMQ